jgi:hypothetical protein
MGDVDFVQAAEGQGTIDGMNAVERKLHEIKN